MPRPRQVKSTAPSPSPARLLEEQQNHGSTAQFENEAQVDADGEVETEAEAEAGKEEDGIDGEDGEQVAEEGTKISMADRQAKLRELRLRMSQSTAANRRDLVADHQKSRVSAKEIARLEKQRKLAQTLRLKADAESSGIDLEREKAWKWSIEQNEKWEQKEEEAKAKQDTHFHNAEDDAHKRYMRNIRNTKTDLAEYNRLKDAAMGVGGAAVAGPSRTATGLTAAEDFYRGAETLSYGDSKPSEEAVDRVISKINNDIGKKKRAKKEDDSGDITYINDRNKVFNKKISRYFDKYTKEIKASLERGTAL